MKKTLLAIVWVISFGLLTYSLIYTENWIFNGTVILGWILFAIQITMSHSENIYLFVKRFWFEIKNPDCIWNMQVIFHGTYDRKSLEQIENIFNLNNKKVSNIITLSNVRKIFSLGSLRFEVVVDELKGEIYFSIHDMEVSFRRSRKLIEADLAQIFEKAQLMLKPNSEHFGLSVEFKGFNPYFGFFLRRLNLDDIQKFHITFKVDNDRVAVTKNSIEINTDSLQQLRVLSTRYLTLSPAK